jgi:hypothetical protein
VSEAGSRLTRAALVGSLGIAWLNLLLTSRWAAVPGSINGGKRPFFIAALAVASLLAWRWRPAPFRAAWLGRAVLAGGCLVLLVAFFSWFPPSTWRLIPFLDDWPPRYQSTVDAIALLRHGVFTGWQWHFLGGYPIATDITQDLGLWAALPMAVLGAAPGFHAVHLVLFAAVPALVWLDLEQDADTDPGVRNAAAGFAALLAAGYSYYLIRSGDTNSLTGVVSLTATLVAAHAARNGRRAAAAVLPAALTLCYYSHRGFFLYALCFLAIDAIAAWDGASVRRAAIAAGAALVAGLPVSWELWRYPSLFLANNVSLQPPGFHVLSFARQVYYNVEILFRPGRWFNDYAGLANVLLPVTVAAALVARGRVRRYAWFTLGAVAMIRLNYEWFGYVFIRPIHLFPVFLAPVCAWLVCHASRSRALALALTAVIGLYVQVTFQQVPHVAALAEYAPALVDGVRHAPGNLVLVENAFHRDVDVTPGESVPTPFPAHFEVRLPAETGRRLYAGMWDGWQWTPNRDQVFASGTFRGQPLARVGAAEVVAELRRWGVASLFVWSRPALTFLESHAEFQRVGPADRWTEFRLVDPDPRSVVTTTGAGTLDGTTPWGGRVRLAGVSAGDEVIVRANYHPAWRASADGVPVALRAAAGQLAFTAPRAGDYEVDLVYPRYPALTLLAVVAVFAAGLMAMRAGASTVRRTAPTPASST